LAVLEVREALSSRAWRYKVNRQNLGSGARDFLVPQAIAHAWVG